jgi:hypothetical protein
MQQNQNSPQVATSRRRASQFMPRSMPADAVCGARVGVRAAGEDHADVLRLLAQAGTDGADIERDLRRLLPLKNQAEYEPDDVSASTAAKAVERAQRCCAIARRVAAGLR